MIEVFRYNSISDNVNLTLELSSDKELTKSFEKILTYSIFLTMQKYLKLEP